MKTLLVPTDFSENALNSLHYAIEMAKKIKFKIVLLNAFTISAEDLVGQVVKAQEKSNERLKKLGEKISNHSDLIYEYCSREGDPVKVILEFVKEKNIDLVIMGTKGESNLANIIFGSTTARVTQNAECPILVIPDGVTFAPLKKITFATNYNNSDTSVLSNLLEFVRPDHAQINFLHISNKTDLAVDEEIFMEKFEKEVHKKTEYNNITFQILVGKNIENELKEYLTTELSSMLVMSTQHRSLWEKLFGTSLTNQAVYFSPIPVLVYHYNKESGVKLI